ncbi:hypothetical protein FRC10_010905 [Ceratobasidium sp. 414]|nr:hypothetical protein FRC10_010905 [Ceratobasidium sp. 414]
MAKVKSSYSCPYCPASRPTFSGIKRHIASSSKCGKKDEAKLQKLTGTKVKLTRVRHAPPLPPPPPPPPQPPVPDVEMDGVEPERVRGRSVMLEDVQDEPYLQTLRPMRHGSLELIEEVPRAVRIEVSFTDFSAANAEKYLLMQTCPHPMAEPTRWSLYPEPHPDATAGQAIRFEEIADIPPPLYDTSLTDPDTFREAYWLGNLSISEAKANEYFSLPRTRDWHWKNIKQFEAEIDNLPHGPGWHRETVRVPTNDGEEVLDLWKRDVVEIVEMLIRDRRFMRYMRFAPEKHWSSEDRVERIYNEMWSGEWWWRLQTILGNGATIAPIILAADKTQMTMLSGNKSAWPVYLSIGNISKEIRRKPSERAMLLVGYIPITDLTGISNTERRREKRWQLFHTCMESILEPLKEASRRGVEMLCADGGVRRVHPILAAYLADYPEQCLTTCVRENRCPICWVPAGERADYNQEYGLRGKHQTMRNLNDYWAGDSQGVETLGIRPVLPFWANLPYTDISNCIAPDMLHQLNKGVFGEHVVKWCRSIMGKDGVDCRIKGAPRFSGLRHFTQGISVLKQWTGTEWKTLAKVFLPTMAGCSKPEAVAATRNVLDFMYCVHKPEISDTDLEDLDEYLANFHDLKDVFVGTEEERAKMKHLLDSAERFNGIPKLHMLSHYRRFIRELGTPDGYNTEVPERLHIDYVKVPYRASNHVNPTEQMATYLQRKEAWAFLRAYLHDTGILPDPRFSDDSIENGSAEGEEEDGDWEGGGGEDAGDDEGEVWHPKPTLSIAKRPTLGKKPLAYLINKHEARDLIPATLRFLRRLPTTRRGSDLPLDQQDVVPVWTRCRLTHKRLPFLPSVEPQIDRIRTVLPSVDSEGRVKRPGAFDVVLFEPEDNTGANGLHRKWLDFVSLVALLIQLKGFQAGRIRAIFELPHHLKPYYNQKLAYLELFRPFSAGQQFLTNLHTTSHMMNGTRRCAAVVPLSRLRMACHLMPQYQSLDPDLRVSSSTDLLSLHDKFYFNKYASHFLFVIMDYWRKQLGNRRPNIDINPSNSANAIYGQDVRPWRVKDHKDPVEANHALRHITLSPSAPLTIQAIPMKYNIPAHLWSVGFYRLLESLRHASAKSPAAFEHLNDYIYYAYGFYLCLFEEEFLERFRPAWIEALGDLARYRMAVAAHLASAPAPSRPTPPASAMLAVPLPTMPLDLSPTPSMGLRATAEFGQEDEHDVGRSCARDWYALGLEDAPGQVHLDDFDTVLARFVERLEIEGASAVRV